MPDLSQDRIYQLKNEVTISKAFLDKQLKPTIQQCIRRYTGEYVPYFGMSWDIKLNEVYPIVQNNLPSIFFRNPRAFLKARNKTFIARRRNPLSGQMEEVELDSGESAKTQEAILNYCIYEMKYKKEVQKVLLDSLIFPYGVLWHGYKGDFGYTEEKNIYIKNDRPFVQRIAPMRFIWDSTVSISNLQDARWVGRVIDVPFMDLFEDDKLDVDKRLIKGYVGYGDKIGKSTVNTPNLKVSPNPELVGSTSSQGGDTKIIDGPRPMIDYTDKKFRETQAARFIQVQEIFLRPTKKESREGGKGWILLLCDEQSKPLRINDNKIKAEGFPARILEFNPINDAMYGLSDIETYSDIVDQKNAIINLQIRNAQENTKTWVGLSKSGANEEDIQKVQMGQNTVVLFEDANPRDKMFVASPGGSASSELYIIDQRIQKNLEDKSGVTDLKRGFLQSGEESAASVKIRAAGGSARPMYRQDIMSDFIKDSFHYINQLLKQFVPYEDAVRIVGSLDVQWSTNPSREELQADTDVEIDVYSMLPEDPTTELQNLTQILSLMVQALTTPQIQEKIQQEGKTIELTPIIEQILLRQRINNPNVFRNIKPEESQGFVSVEQLDQAKQNVMASLQGQQIPFPPNPNDDHKAKLEVYTSIQPILQALGKQSDLLNQLIQVQTALLAKAQEKEANPGQGVKLSKGMVQPVG